MKNNLVEGRLESIAKRGKAYNIKVDGEWYGAGFTRPECNEGDNVRFKTELNGKWINLVDDSLEVLESRKINPKQTPNYTTKILNSKDDFWAKKEQREITNDIQRNWGASRNTAISFVDLLLKNSALKLPTETAKKADAILKAVEYYASKFRDTVENINKNSTDGVNTKTDFQDLEEESEIDE